MIAIGVGGTVGWRSRRDRGSDGGVRVGLAVAILLTLVGAIGGPAVSAQDAIDLPETAALVPADALFFLSVDLDLASEQWAVADDLLARAGAPGALQALRATILDNTALGTPTAGDDDPLFGGELGVVLSDLPELFSDLLAASMAGDAAPAATPVLSDLADQAGPAFLLKPGDPDGAWNLVQDRLGQAADASGVEVEETTYRDVTIRTLDAETGPDAAVARLDDVIVAAFKPADLEPIIDTAEGGEPTLRDYAPMAEVRTALNPDLLVFGFGNNEALLDAFGPAFQQLQARSAELAESYGIASPVPQIDPDAVNTGLGVWVEETGLRTDVVNVLEGGDPYPILATQAASETDARVSADALIFANAFDLGPTGSLSAGVGLQIALAVNGGVLAGTPLASSSTTPGLDEITPEFIEAQFAEAAEELGFDLRDDLLNQLVGEHVFALMLEPALFVGNIDEGLNAVLASDVDSPNTVAETAQRIASRLERDVDEADIATRQVDGDTVYILSDPTVADDPALEFGVVDGKLLIGLGDGIDGFLAGPADTLADDERYQRVMATLPSEHQGSLYMNVGQVVGLVQLATANVLPEIYADATPDDAARGVPAVATAATPEALAPASAIEAFASVISTEGSVQRISTILYVGEG